MERITATDINVLKQIENNAKHIMEIYKNLYFEDCMQGIETSRDFNLLKELICAKSVENDLYEKLCLTPSRANSMIGYLIRNNPNFARRDDRILDVIENSDESNLILGRMITYLERESHKNEKDYKDWLLSSGTLLSEEIATNLFSNICLENTIKKDCERAFLYFNQADALPSDRYKHFKMKISYNLLFLSVDAEDDFLYHEGNDKEELYFSFPFIGEIRKIDRTLANDSIEEVGMNILNVSIMNLVHPNELAITFINDSFYHSYLKTGLCIFHCFGYYDKLVDNLEEQLYTIDRNENGHCSLSLNRIINTIDEFEQVAPKCKYLHFYPQK